MFFGRRASKIAPLTPFPLKVTCSTEGNASPKRSELKHLTKEALQRIRTYLFMNREDFNDDNLEDGKLTKFYWSKFQNLEFIIGILIITSFLFSVLQYEISYFDLNPSVNKILIFILNIGTALIILILFFRYKILLLLNKERKIFSNKAHFFSSGISYNFLLECLIIIPHPNYFLEDLSVSLSSLNQTPALTYKINHLLSIYMTLRLLLIVRIYLNCTIFRTSRSFRLCKIYGVEYGYIYTARCLMKIEPLKHLATIFIFNMIVFAYILKVCESPFDDNVMNFKYYFNALWCVVITMTTTGYGDYYARTPLGRIISIFISFFGIFIVSLTVVSITNTLELNKTEMKSMNLLLRLEERKSLRSNAAKLLTSIVAFKSRKRKMLITPHMMNSFKIKIRKYRNDFSENIRKIKTTMDPLSSHEIMNRNFDYMRGELLQVLKNQDQMMENLGLKVKTTKITTIQENKEVSKGKSDLSRSIGDNSKQNDDKILEKPIILISCNGKNITSFSKEKENNLLFEEWNKIL